MEEERFQAALARALLRKEGKGQIGMLGEKTLHSALKYYYEPDETKHERELAGFLADILNGEGVTEIQTRNLFSMKRKLRAFSGLVPVTVVHPVIRTRGLIYLDPQTGELSKRRVSPRHGRPEDAFSELVHIREELALPRLRFMILLVDADEYRIKDGLETRRGKKPLKFELVPRGIAGEYALENNGDYLRLLPEGLERSAFTVRELAECARLPERTASAMCAVMLARGALERKKEGKRFVYSVKYEDIAYPDEGDGR